MTTHHVLAVALGPVQDFIAQARRTRDLWLGSRLLSEVSKAAAEALRGAGARLVFPSILSDDSLPEDVSNKIVAIVQSASGEDVRRASEKARRGAVERLSAIADEAKAKAVTHRLLAEKVDAVWSEQIATLLEFYAAWAPFDPSLECGPSSLDDASKAADEAIAGRKLHRDFRSWAHDVPGAAKSSLDGGRVSVLKPRFRTTPTGPFSRFRIDKREELDAVGVTKRIWIDPDASADEPTSGAVGFPPIANVALYGWIEEARRRAAAGDASLCNSLATLERLAAGCNFRRVGGVRTRRIEWSYDAQLFLLDRLPTLLEESLPEQAAAERRARVATIRNAVIPLHRELGEPFPYVAVLMADGDRMGETISRVPHVKGRQALSRALSGFARRVAEIVNAHRGALVYAGGDDVLALVCLPHAVACARRLAQSFDEHLAPAIRAAGLGRDATPTLSVGLGVGHVLDGLSSLIQLAKDAERLAKGDEVVAKPEQRNALGIVFDKRSGGRRQWRARWTGEGPFDPEKILARDLELLEERLSTKKVYEIAADLRRFKPPADETPPSRQALQWSHAIRADVARTLARTDVGGALSFGDVGLPELEVRDAFSGRPAALWRLLEAWTQRILIAREIGRAIPRTSRGRRAGAALAAGAPE